MFCNMYLLRFFLKNRAGTNNVKPVAGEGENGVAETLLEQTKRESVLLKKCYQLLDL